MAVVERLLLPTLTQYVFRAIDVRGVFVDVMGTSCVSAFRRTLGERITVRSLNLPTMEDWLTATNKILHDDLDSVLDVVYCIGFFVPTDISKVQTQQFIGHAASLGPGFMVWYMPRLIPNHWTPSGYDCIRAIEGMEESHVFYVFKRRKTTQAKSAFEPLGEHLGPRFDKMRRLGILVQTVSTSQEHTTLDNLARHSLYLDRFSPPFLLMNWYSFSLRHWMVCKWSPGTTITRETTVAEDAKKHCVNKDLPSLTSIDMGSAERLTRALTNTQDGLCNQLGRGIYEASQCKRQPLSIEHVVIVLASIEIPL